MNIIHKIKDQYYTLYNQAKKKKKRKRLGGADIRATQVTYATD